MKNFSRFLEGVDYRQSNVSRSRALGNNETYLAELPSLVGVAQVLAV